MSKYCGVIGFARTEKTKPGIWSDDIVERRYLGDVTKNYQRHDATEYLNDNVNVSNIISIMADPYAFDNFFAIRYVEWMGAKWKVTSVEVQRPRLILTIGGVYNGEDGASVG